MIDNAGLLAPCSSLALLTAVAGHVLCSLEFKSSSILGLLPAGILSFVGLCYVSKQDFPVVLLICFPINDNFARTHTKNIPSCCDINNFASTLESKE